MVTDEEGRTVGPGGVAAPGGAPQGAAGLSGLKIGRGRGNKRRRTTSAGSGMSEAQEGKVS